MNNDPALTYTLDDFVELQSVDNMTYYNFSILEIIDGVQHLDHNLVEDYLKELEATCVTWELSNEEMSRYRYNPDLLAYDIYGSVQLDFVILLLNDMIDPKDFDRRKLKLPYASSLSIFLNTLYSKESNYINENRANNNLYS